MTRYFILFGITLIALTSCTASTDQVLDIQSYSSTNGANESGPRFGDADPHKWKTKPPWTYPIHGIDISKWQGEIDWLKVRQSGVSFAYIKATEGGDRIDNAFAANWHGAAAARIPRGAYHFYYFCTSAAKQAAWFIRNVPKSRGALPPVLDMEWNSHSPSCKLRPSAAKIRSEMRIFLKKLESHYGQKPVIYSTVDFFRENGLSNFEGYQYWLRSVAGHPSKVYPKQAWSFWQYTGTGRVPGITEKTDINTFAGSKVQWRKWLENNTRK